MATVETNQTSFRVVRETTLGIAATTGWFTLTVGGVDTFGGTYTAADISVIEPSRQNIKTKLVSASHEAGLNGYFSHDAALVFAEYYSARVPVNLDVTNIQAVSTTATTYVVPTMTAGQQAKFATGTLVHSAGWSNAANNGLKVTTGAATATTITVAGNVVETAPVSAIDNATRISIAGFRAAPGSQTWTWDNVNKQATLGGTGIGTALLARGLEVGQYIHVGSPNNLGAAVNAFQNVAANDMYGFARVTSITANAVVFKNVSAKLQFTDSTPPAGDVDYCFGNLVRNPARSGDVDDVKRTMTIEQLQPAKFDDGSNEHVYVTGGAMQNMNITFAAEDLVKFDMSVLGTNTIEGVRNAQRKAGAANAISLNKVDTIASVSEMPEVKLVRANGTIVSLLASSLTINIENPVNENKIINQFGSYVNTRGTFKTSISAELLADDPDKLPKADANETVSFYSVINTTDSVIAIEVPATSFNKTGTNFADGQAITENVEGVSFADPITKSSLLLSTIPLAMPK